MIHVLKKHHSLTLLLFIVLIGALLRFYKLDWGQGLFTHPDEYHIVASVGQLSFPDQMHPHFFSYGTVTIYLIYFSQEIIKYFSSTFNFELLTLNSFLVGRFYSALFSTLTILVVYGISRIFLNKKFSFLAALLVALTPGLIQQAHFATPESALIFFLFGSLLFMLKSIKQNKIIHLTLASIFLGLALGVKISSIVFLLPLIATIYFGAFSKYHLRGAPARRGHLGGGESIRLSTPPRWRLLQLKFIILILSSLTTTLATFALVAPFVFLDFPAFRSNLQYEGALALGNIPVFYTRQFIDTIPIIFQFEKIFPYALGPAVLVFGVLGFVYLTINIIKILSSSSESRAQSRESREVSNVTMKQLNNYSSRQARTIMNNKNLIIIMVAFLSFFLPSAFLFAKWTRFIAPTFPFFAIFAAFFLQWLSKRTKLLYNSLLVILTVGTILWTTAFFSIYTNPDIRITASDWLRSHAKEGSTFLVEGGNTIDIPLGGNFQRISLHFYPLEQDSLTRERITDAFYYSDYFLVQSRRVFMNHQRLRHLYPKTALFYDALFNGKLGFEQIKEFHSYPRLQAAGYKLQVPDEGAEETWSVFDHPVIRVFKKNAQLTREGYARFLENENSLWKIESGNRK